MDELVKRLRGQQIADSDIVVAADAIDALRAEIERLRAALCWAKSALIGLPMDEANTAQMDELIAALKGGDA